MKVIDYVGNEHFVPGPPDLQKYGADDQIFIVGDPTEMDKSAWGFAIGMFVMRGGTA